MIACISELSSFLPAAHQVLEVVQKFIRPPLDFIGCRIDNHFKGRARPIHMISAIAADGVPLRDGGCLTNQERRTYRTSVAQFLPCRML
jgi:hypothetical protein